jgi:hypothetical protein
MNEFVCIISLRHYMIRKLWDLRYSYLINHA